MQPGTSNKHHGVPRSFTGSDGDSNITVLDCMEHAAFHRMAGHKPPCYLQRALLLASVDSCSLPVNMYRDALAQLMQPDWRDIYGKGTIREPTYVRNELSYWEQASEHHYRHLNDEAYMTADAIAHVQHERHLRPASHALINDARAFFHESNPALAIRRYLIDRTGGEYKWTKPLILPVRNGLKKIFEGPNREHRRNKERNALIDVLEEHRTRLHNRIATWQLYSLEDAAPARRQSA